MAGLKLIYARRAKLSLRIPSVFGWVIVGCARNIHTGLSVTHSGHLTWIYCPFRNKSLCPKLTSKSVCLRILIDRVIEFKCPCTGIQCSFSDIAFGFIMPKRLDSLDSVCCHLNQPLIHVILLVSSPFNKSIIGIILNAEAGNARHPEYHNWRQLCYIPSREIVFWWNKKNYMMPNTDPSLCNNETSRFLSYLDQFNDLSILFSGVNQAKRISKRDTTTFHMGRHKIFKIIRDFQKTGNITQSHMFKDQETSHMPYSWIYTSYMVQNESYLHNLWAIETFAKLSGNRISFSRNSRMIFCATSTRYWASEHASGKRNWMLNNRHSSKQFKGKWWLLRK
jgi:hypothetical protein